MRAKKKSAEERRKQILETALHVFSKKGYHLTRTKELAEEAGISEPAIYKYFKSKKELYLCLLNDLKGRLENNWDSATANYEKPEEILMAFGMAFYTGVIEDPEIAKVIFQTFTEVGMEEVLDFSRKMQMKLHTNVKKVIEKGVEIGDFREETDCNLAAWRFLNIGLTISVMSLLGFQDQFGAEKVIAWGDSLIEGIKKR